MRVKSILIAGVAALSLSFAAGISHASADVWTTQEGAPVRLATALTVFQGADERLLERLRVELMSSVRTTDPLPYSTLQEIPDARALGYGDCKSISMAMRSMLIKEGFSPDTLLLATALTEKGEPHAVLLIRGKWQGREETRVFDIRVREITTIDRLIEHGYRFQGRQSAGGADAVMVNFNGRSIY